MGYKSGSTRRIRVGRITPCASSTASIKPVSGAHGVTRPTTFACSLSHGLGSSRCKIPKGMSFSGRETRCRLASLKRHGRYALLLQGCTWPRHCRPATRHRRQDQWEF